MARAFVFPGQGSPYVGMGADLAAQFPSAKAWFDEVDEALGEKLSTLMADGPMDALSLTANTQPALMAHSVAAQRVLQEEVGLSIADCAFAAGHSLGEYSALCAAGSITLSDTAKLLRLRGQAMQDAVPVGKGSMAALIGVNVEKAQVVIDALKGDGICEIANDNGLQQVVVSGETAAIESICAGARGQGVKIAKQLPVSAPFHSSMMAPAQAVMRDALAACDIKSPQTPIMANVTAAPVSSPDDIRDLLVRQVTGRVRWTESVQAMAAAGVSEIVEIGAGETLCGLIKRIEKGVALKSFGKADDINGIK